MKKICLVAFALCMAVALSGCGGEATDAAETSTSSAATLTIANMSFGAPLTVAPGAQITVKNDDTAEHSVTSQTEGQFDVHVDGGEQGTLTAPTAPGEYAFHCVYHPSMTGTLIVE
jgi:plastocyanin